MKVFKKYGWVITGVLAIYSFIEGLGNADMMTSAIVLTVVTFILYRVSKKADEPSSTMSFHLCGIHYEGRQHIISQLKQGDLLTSRYFTFEGEPAIELYLNNSSVGFVPKERAKELNKRKPMFFVVRMYQFNDGAYGAEIRVQ